MIYAIGERAGSPQNPDTHLFGSGHCATAHF